MVTYLGWGLGDPRTHGKRHLAGGRMANEPRTCDLRPLTSLDKLPSAKKVTETADK